MKAGIRLCPVLQGVQFIVDDGGESIRALILKEALELHFGAADCPDEWIQAYLAHQDVIDRVALTIHKLDATRPVVVLRGTEPGLELKTRAHAPVLGH